MQTPRWPDCTTLRNGPPGHPIAAQGLRGFTLVELLIVVAIIMIIMVLAVPTFGKIKDQAKISRCMSEIRGLEREIAAYATEKGSYPPGLADINRGELRDPWGSLYVYSAPTREDVGVPINTDYDLFSKGENGANVASISDALSIDDVIRADDGVYVGLAIKY